MQMGSGFALRVQAQSGMHLSMPRLTAAQRIVRHNGLGSSDVSVICCHQFGKSDWDVWLEKTTPLEPCSYCAPGRDRAPALGSPPPLDPKHPCVHCGGTGLEPDDGPDDDAQEMGHELEPVIAAWYERATGQRTIPGGHFVHATNAWAMCTLDRRVVHVHGSDTSASLPTTGVECKLVGARPSFDWTDEDDGMPDYVRVQVAWQLYVTGLQRIDVAAYLGGTSRRIYRVERDARLEELIVSAATDAWTRIQQRRKPPWDASEACKEYVRKLYPRDTGPIREASPEELEMLHMRAQQAGWERDAKKKKDELDVRLRAAIADDSGIRSADGKLKATWKAGKGGVRRYRGPGASDDE